MTLENGNHRAGAFLVGQSGLGCATERPINMSLFYRNRGRVEELTVWRRFCRQWSQRNVQRDIATFREVVRRIVEVAEPDQVILFGSAARGQLRPNSDFDLLVIKSNVPDTHELTRYLHAHLFDIRMPIDIIVATPEEVQASRYKMLGQIYAQGRRVYPSSQTQRYRPRS